MTTFQATIPRPTDLGGILPSIHQKLEAVRTIRKINKEGHLYRLDDVKKQEYFRAKEILGV